MTRYLNCAECGENKEAGTRMLNGYEPAEYERVTWGMAKQPMRKQRTIRVNGEPILMDMTGYTCDWCNAEIKPGDRCYGWTVWAEGQQEPVMWEDAYLSPEAAHRPGCSVWDGSGGKNGCNCGVG